MREGLARYGFIYRFRIALMSCLIAFSGQSFSLSQNSIDVEDDDGFALQLTAPAQRLIALGPNLVENLFAIGAGDLLIGASEYADYPEKARSIPRVGSHSTVNFELILSMKPDLVLVWQSGFGQEAIDKLRSLGLKVFVSEPHSLEDIGSLMQRLGVLTGRQQQAGAAVDGFLSKLNNLRAKYASRAPVSVFYQVWNQPLQTLNGNHVVGAVINLCGGRNVFANLPMIAPVVSIESVIVANPELIVASGSDGIRPAWLDDWYQWPMLAAVQSQQLQFIEPGILVRHAPRILSGAEQMCGMIDRVRRQRGAEGE